jgi:hypothetical protein
MTSFRTARERYVVASDSVDSPARFARRDDFDQGGRPASKAEEMPGGEMRCDGSGAAGQNSRQSPSMTAARRVPDAKGASEAGVKAPCFDSRID